MNCVPEPLLELNNLSKSYNDLPAVQNIALTVNRGEIFGFLGPNGAGKTTTMKCCAGLLRPSGGSVHIAGFDLARQPAAAKALLGFVPDNPYLYEKMTGHEMAVFAARLYGVATEGLSDKVISYFRLFEMEAECKQLIQGYSRGMRQKTALVAALLHQPSLLLVDEPTANLDPRSARLVKDIFQSLKAQGRSVFLSTHVMEIAENLCDRIAIIAGGKLQALGSMEQLRKQIRGGSLEEIFLALTGGDDPETQKVLQELIRAEGER
ncbi:MAG: ABC transporter ATP-binding protein [Dethiobacter sp.]|nr:ABC transporter ATP-binding protein [Dethiobacter sp.]